MEIYKENDNQFKCDLCNDVSLFLVTCRNCNKKFCYTEKCGLHFDHSNNTVYSICKICVDKISNKMKVAVDYTKLKCLKKKIKLRKMVKN